MNTAPTDSRASAAAHPRGRTRAVLSATAAALFLALGLATAPAALAHDSLIGTTPKNGAQVSKPLDSVELSFSGDLKSIGTEVSLVDGTGAKHNAETSISRNVLTVDFGEALPAGDYTLTWRAVSSDGHPIEGTQANQEALAFTVRGGRTPSSPAASTPADPSTTASSPAPAEQDPSTAAAAEGQAATSGGLPTAAIWLVIAVVVIAAAALVFAKARRQTGSGH